MNARDLEKMTTPKLREEALKIEGLTGVHGMNKEELIKVLKAHYGIQDAPTSKGPSATRREMKAKIRELKSARLQATQSGDRKRATVLRKRVKRLKRRLRRTA